MDLSIYDIIKGPVVSDKAYKLNKALGRLVIKVHPKANKSLIKEALEKLFNVEVDKIRVLIRKGKVRKVNRIPGRSKDVKIAIVTLKEGYKIEALEQASTQVAAESMPKSIETKKE